METQALVRAVRRRRGLLKSGDLRRWIASQQGGPWIDLLSEAAEEHEIETGGAEVPAVSFIEWLAEWCRDARRRQRGLLLLTAHRAKGLEFDHVVVLDGGWGRRSRDEDVDAPRRLYYVAMTRAKQTLTLCRLRQRAGVSTMRSKASLPFCGARRSHCRHRPRSWLAGIAV